MQQEQKELTKEKFMDTLTLPGTLLTESALCDEWANNKQATPKSSVITKIVHPVLFDQNWRDKQTNKKWEQGRNGVLSFRTFHSAVLIEYLHFGEVFSTAPAVYMWEAPCYCWQLASAWLRSDLFVKNRPVNHKQAIAGEAVMVSLLLVWIVPNYPM